MNERLKHRVHEKYTQKEVGALYDLAARMILQSESETKIKKVLATFKNRPKQSASADVLIRT